MVLQNLQEQHFFSLEKAHSSERKLDLSQNIISAIENINWSMYGGVGLCGLGMPNILHRPFYFKPKDIKKYSIQYMMQIELTYISIKSWLLILM